jgi:hypothetical protein
MDKITENFYTINSVASTLWKWLETPKSIDELALALQNEFDISRELALQDTLEFTKNLIRDGFVLPIQQTVDS